MVYQQSSGSGLAYSAISLRRMSLDPSSLSKSCCGKSLFPLNYFMFWPPLRLKSRHLLLAQCHLEVPSLHCCLWSLSLLGNPADINCKTQIKSRYFLTSFFSSRLTCPCSSRGTSSLSLEDSGKSISALRFTSVPHPAMSPVLRVYHA